MAMVMMGVMVIQVEDVEILAPRVDQMVLKAEDLREDKVPVRM